VLTISNPNNFNAVFLTSYLITFIGKNIIRLTGFGVSYFYDICAIEISTLYWGADKSLA